MPKRYETTFSQQVMKRVDSMTGAIILREDLADLGSARQVSRALQKMVEDEKAIKIGHGIYAKAERGTYIDEPVIITGFTNACLEVLQRFNVKWEPGQATKDYNEGRSTQVPARLIIRLKSRFRRSISFNGRSLIFEEMVYVK